MRGLDFSTRGPSVAMQAAQAAQTSSRPGGAAAAQLDLGQPVETSTSAPAGAVAGLTVRPESTRPGKVIASSDAASLTSPNFSTADAEGPPLAVGVVPGVAIGRQVVDNRPAAAGAGLLGANPELLGQQPTRGEIGMTAVF